MTARTAVPNEPPICWTVLVTALEWAICGLSRPRKATAITGMVTAPDLVGEPADQVPPAVLSMPFDLMRHVCS